MKKQKRINLQLRLEDIFYSNTCAADAITDIKKFIQNNYRRRKNG